jgi:hypothetical protein
MQIGSKYRREYVACLKLAQIHDSPNVRVGSTAKWNGSQKTRKKETTENEIGPKNEKASKRNFE